MSTDQKTIAPPSPRPTGGGESAPPVSGKFIGYFLLFVLLVFLFYIFPEVLVFKNSGFAPVENLTEAETSTSLTVILSNMWRDRAQILNPMNNPLVRFFLVTVIVGIVFDKVKQYTPVDDERGGQ